MVETECQSEELAFEVWQFRLHYLVHIMIASFFFIIPLLVVLFSTEVQPSLLGSAVISAIFVPIRRAAHFAKNQALAHRITEYTTFAFIALRLASGRLLVAEPISEPIGEALNIYGWDVVRPLAMSIMLPTLPMRFSFTVVVYILYAARLLATTDSVMVATLPTAFDNINVSEMGIQLSNMLPIFVFFVSLFGYTVSLRQSRALFEHMMELKRSHAQEVLATKHATRCEQRAHEAERHVYEESLRQRNRYLGAMCHDFGTPVAVLQMLLSMMRKRVRKDLELERQRKEASALTDVEAMAEGTTAQFRIRGAGSSEAEKARPNASTSSTPPVNTPLEPYEDSARMLDLIRRASAGFELLEVTRQKAIAFSKLQAGGRLVPDLKAFEVAELLRKSASIAQDTGKNETVAVETDLSGDLPLVVKSDANWLYMILVNFASNSMKHTTHGSVTISARRAGTSHLRLEVSDTGSGVPAEFVPSLFQPFTSASTNATSVESTGLGLYHSKQLASILSGRVGYRPNAAGGATFVVEVPITFVSAAKTQEVLAKNRLELEGLVDTVASPEDRARAQVQRRPAPSARGDRGVETVSAFSSATTMMASAAATSTTPSSPAPTANAPAASARATEGVTQNVDALATVTAHDGGGGVDSATARDGGQSSQSPRPSPRALASPRQDENALTSGVLAPSVLLTSLLSRVPPPLLVDDSELSRVRMSVQLNAWAKVEAMEAESGDKALHILTAAEMPLRPSVVLISVNMAGRSGVETCRAIRAWEHSRGVAQHERLRIVGLLTLTNDAAGRAACLDAGMDDALPKPFDAAVLLGCLQKLLS